MNHVAPEHLAIIGLVGLCVVFGIALVAIFKAGISKQKKEWLELSSLLAANDLPHCSKIMEDLAVGDLAGAFKECEYLLRLLRDPKQLATALNNILIAQIPTALNDPTRRQAVAAAISSWIAANTSLATTLSLPTK